MVTCACCGTPLYHENEACPNCLEGSGLCDRPPAHGIQPARHRAERRVIASLLDAQMTCSGLKQRISELEKERDEARAEAERFKDRAIHCTTVELALDHSEREAERLRGFVQSCANDGCGCVTPNGDTCRELSPGDPDNWCWCCQAGAALEPAPTTPNPDTEKALDGEPIDEAHAKGEEERDERT